MSAPSTFRFEPIGSLTCRRCNLEPMGAPQPVTTEKHFQSFAEMLEPLLKWLSIAYGLGFLTVLLNTAPLNIPALELAEPIQIWVGVPLAFVFWLVIAAYRYFLAKARELPSEIRMWQAQYDEILRLTQEGRHAEASAEFFSLSMKYLFIYSLPYLPRSWFLRGPIAYVLGQVSEAFAGRRATNPTQLPTVDEKDLKLMRRVLEKMSQVQAVLLFLSRIGNVFIPLIALAALYIFILYPRVPQSWGGGKPVSVTMLLVEEKIPLDGSALGELFSASEPASGKTRMTKPITLLYATEHAYYIRLDKRILRLSEDAVGAVVF